MADRLKALKEAREMQEKHTAEAKGVADIKSEINEDGRLVVSGRIVLEPAGNPNEVKIDSPLSAANRLAIYGNLLGVSERMPETVDAKSGFFSEVSENYTNLQKLYEGFFTRFGEELDKSGNGLPTDASEEQIAGYNYEVYNTGNQIFAGMLAQTMAYNDVLKADGKDPVDIDKILSGKVDEQTEASINKHFNGLSPEIKTEYMTMAGAVVKDLSKDVVASDPNSKALPSVVTQIAKGAVISQGGATYDQAKTAVRDILQEQQAQQVAQNTSIVAFYGGSLGMKAENGQMTKEFVTEANSRFVERQQAYMRQGAQSPEGQAWVAEGMKKLQDRYEKAGQGDRWEADKAQNESELTMQYAQQHAFISMASEVSAINAYRMGTALKSEHVEKADTYEEQVAQGSVYLDHLKETDPDTYNKLRQDAVGIVGNFEIAQKVVADTIANTGKPLAIPGMNQPEAVATQKDPAPKEDVIVSGPKVPDGMNRDEYLARFGRVEEALSLLAPQLNAQETISGLDVKPETELKTPGKVDGVFDQQAFESYKGVMGHLNFLAGMYENKSLLIASEMVPDIAKKAANKAAELFGKGGEAEKYAAQKKQELDEVLNKDKPKEFLPENAAILEKMLIEQIDEKLKEFKSDTEYGKRKYSEDIAELQAQRDLIPQVIDDLTVLKAAGLLKGPAEMVNYTVPSNNTSGANLDKEKEKDKDKGNNPEKDNKKDDPKPKDNPEKLEDHIGTVKITLGLVGNQINNLDITGFNSGFVKDMVGGLIRPLSLEELSDKSNFGSESQDFAAKMIMGLKMLNGTKNASGYYDDAVGETLKTAILTKPQFAQVRDALNKGLAAEGMKIGYYGFDQGAEPSKEQVAERTRFVDMIVNYKDRQPAEPAKDADKTVLDKYMKEMEAYEKFGEKHKAEIKGAEQLNNFFNSMNVLHQEEMLLNDKEASSINQNNLMIDMASAALDKFSPGLKMWIKDFFTNSPIGQMVGSLIGMKGFDISRLWGEKRDVSDPNTQVQDLQRNFDSLYKEAAEKAGPGADTATVMGEAQKLAADKMDSFGFKATMKILFKGEDESFIKNTVNDALKNASGASTPEEARALFTDSVRMAMEAKGIDPNTIDQAVKNTKEASEEYNKQNPDQAADLAVAAQTTVSPKNTLNLDPNDPNAHIIGASVIADGDAEHKVRLLYTPNKDAFIQGPSRFSNGRIQDIQEVIEANAEKLGLALKPEGMKIDGTLSDMATPYTCAMLEEILIRAKVHEWQAADKDITQGDLDALKTDLVNKGLGRMLADDGNMDAVMAYMEANGVSVEDREKFKNNMDKLEDDFYSTRLPGNPKQDSSVLEQSLAGGQFKMDMATFVPLVVMEPVPAPKDGDPLEELYKKHNPDPSREVPIFYMKEGDTAVYAAIRNKHGDNDPTNDTFEELRFRMYQTQNDINEADYPDAKKLLDNYNFGKDAGIGEIRTVINEVLDLRPKEYGIDVKIEQKPEEPKESPAEIAARVARQHGGECERPETFVDFPKMTNYMKGEAAEMLNVYNNESVMRIAERDHRHPLDVYFDQKSTNIPVLAGSQRTGVVFLEPEQFGVKHEKADVIMAVRNHSGSWDFRYVNYEEHQIRPFDQHRGNSADEKCADMREIVDPSKVGYRRLDHVLDEHSRGSGGVSTHLGNAKSGYIGMRAIVPGYQNSVSGFRAVYGYENPHDVQAYRNATVHNYNTRTAYENAESADDQMRKSQYTNRYGNGYTKADDKGQPRCNDDQRVPDCRGQFAHKAGQPDDKEWWEKTKPGKHAVSSYGTQVKALGEIGKKIGGWFGGLGKNDRAIHENQDECGCKRDYEQEQLQQQQYNQQKTYDPNDPVYQGAP